MPIKPKSFFSSRGHEDNRERLFCVDEDGLLWVLYTPRRVMGRDIIPVKHGFGDVLSCGPLSGES